MNNVNMSATLTKDPEVRTYGEDGILVNFSGAVRKKFKKSEDESDDFFNFVAFGKTAEFIEKYFHKGDTLFIQGELHNNNYTKEDGTKVYRDQITVNSVDFGPKKGGSGNSSDNAGSEVKTSRRGGSRRQASYDEDLDF